MNYFLEILLEYNDLYKIHDLKPLFIQSHMVMSHLFLVKHPVMSASLSSPWRMSQGQGCRYVFMYNLK